MTDGPKSEIGTGSGTGHRPPARRRRWPTVAGAVLVAVVVVGVVVLSGGGGADVTTAASQATATTSIRQQDLVESETVDGTLGYSDARSVVNRLTGTVTRTPKVGSVVKANRRLYEVDGKAVYLLDGYYPAYRTLGAGLTGDDVRQLERNLRRFGLDTARDMKVDGTWDAATTAAVKRWQARNGMRQDGTIEKGRIVFQPGSRRISAITLPVGSTAPRGGSPGPEVTAALMTTTSTNRIVAVDLEATKQALAREGAAVTVQLPDDSDVAGTIVRVGKVAEKNATPQDEDPPATIELVIRLTTSAGTGLDQAPVDVKLEQRRAKDVLTVPVTALLARAGGAFAVEVRDGGTRRIVPVKTGLYTDSFVEIEGTGLRAGLKVSNAEI